MHIRHSLLAFAVATGLAGSAHAQAPAAAPPPAPLTLSTPAYPDGGQFPLKYTQAAPGVPAGEGVSPPISWTNTPAGAKSFVLHMHDLDAVRNKTTDDQLHWIVWNVPATATGLAEGQPKGAKLPDGSFQTSASGAFYRGPGAPATGPFHHYIFELFALDTALSTEPATDPFETRAKVMAAMQGHILGRAAYSALFRRPN